ncbi:sulfonate transport system permease protein [Methylophilus rhizosphaerae]|uniref:Sulfonate transport system permease protein n=1 Tax=Methylophilus rhizosphaerae TaxID=492660 RepID=A0A1G8Z933_9PROT|nr:ABC transporter permease [Methylophilus rhizosphaerae]SDK10905.1 sulfonate transport system permease protein [Methylophilus rhizosphaerae]
MTRDWKRFLPFLISPLLLLVVWWWATAAGWYSDDVLVSPAAVLATLQELVASGELALHLKTSFLRLLIGFGTGAVTGVLFGIWMAISPRVEAFVLPTFQGLRQVPTIALIPILILLLGVDESFKVIIVVKAAFLTVALAAYDATKGVSRNYFEVARIYHLPKTTLYRKLIIPAITPPVFTGLRIAFSRSWTILVAAELLAADSGIGQMMQLGREMFRLDIVMVGVVITGLVGFSIDKIFKWAEIRLIPWQPAVKA